MDIHFARSQLHTLVPIGVLAELAWGTCSIAYQVCSYSSRQKNLTFCCISNIISMSIPFVSSSFCIVHTHVHQLLLRSRELLTGRRYHTAVIARSPCCVEEAIFQEVVSNRKAQWMLKGTWWCSRHQKKAVLLLSRYILLEKLEWSPHTMKVISLASNEKQKR